MINIYMAGDSTMSIKSARAAPETGWGMPFTTLVEGRASVTNYAVNGRSTRTFREEGLWAKIHDNLQPGDIVIIQFGHNDEVAEKVGRYTTPDQFQSNLRSFIAEARAREGEPILLTPVVRRAFTEEGKLRDSHPYAPLVREVAKATGVCFVDMEARTKSVVEEMGEASSRALFLHLAPGDHPNYPQGRRDNTHLSPAGAETVARLFLDELERSRHRLGSMQN